MDIFISQKTINVEFKRTNNFLKTVNGPPPRSGKTPSHLTYISYFFPWNAFITAVDYFAYIYPNTHVDRIFPVAYTLAHLIKTHRTRFNIIIEDKDYFDP
ncbi:Equilibrative nucleotide transporter 1, partial [Cucurbita argyrosperma subsp. argyrosperma]